MTTRTSTLRVEIDADARGVGPGISSAESRFSKLGGTIGKVGKLAAGGLAVGLGLAAVAGFKLAQAAAEDEKAAALMSNSLHKAAGATDKQVAATERWISRMGKSLGVADDDLRPAMSRLAVATGDVGKAQDLARIAMDVSAGTGKSLEAVTTALAKAQNGSVGGLSRLGAKTTDAAGKTLSFKKITEDLARVHRGSAAKAANTAAGRMSRLKLQLGEMGEAIGAKLLPVGNKLVGWALKMAPKAEALGNTLGKKLGPAFRAVGEFITGKVIPASQKVYQWFVEKIAPGIKRAVQPVLEKLKGAWRDVSAAVERNRPQLEKIGNVLRELAEFVANKVAPVVGKVLSGQFVALGKVVGGIIDTIGRLVDIIQDAVDAVQSLVAWIKKIDFPNIPDIPGLGSGSYGIATAGVPAGLATGSGDLASLLSYFSRTSTSRPAAVAPVVIRNEITIQGAVDPVSTARQIRKLLDDQARRFAPTS